MRGRRMFVWSVGAGGMLATLTWLITGYPLTAASAEESADAMDLLPATVECVVQVRGLDAFRDRLDKLLRETMPAAADDISRALDEQVRAFLEGRDRKELDGQRAIFLAIGQWKALHAEPPAIIIGLPVRDGDAFLRGFLSKEEYKLLQPQSSGCQRTVLAGQEVFLYQRSGYVLLTPQALLAEQLTALRRDGATRPAALRSELRDEELRIWSQADIAAYLKLPPLVTLIQGELAEARRQLPTMLQGQPFAQSQQVVAEVALDLVELGRDVQHCLVTGSIEKEGVRLRALLRARPDSPLQDRLVKTSRHSVADLDRMPDGLHHYGSWEAEWLLLPILQRYAQAIRQAGEKLSPASASVEKLLAETAEKLLHSGIRRCQWGLDSRYRGLLVLEAEKPELARQALLQCCDTLAGLVPKDGVRVRVQQDAGLLLGLPLSRVDIEIRWSFFSTAHGDDAAVVEAFLRHLFGHQWTLWFVADNQRLYIVSTSNQKEAEQWLQRYRSGTDKSLTRLRQHRAPQGNELTGLAMLQFPGWWRHLLESVEKAVSIQGLGNLIPKDAYPGDTTAFLAFGCKVDRDSFLVELWAPKETIQVLNHLWIFAVYGLL